MQVSIAFKRPFSPFGALYGALYSPYSRYGPDSVDRMKSEKVVRIGQPQTRKISWNNTICYSIFYYFKKIYFIGECDINRGKERYTNNSSACLSFNLFILATWSFVFQHSAVRKGAGGQIYTANINFGLLQEKVGRGRRQILALPQAQFSLRTPLF